MPSYVAVRCERCGDWIFQPLNGFMFRLGNFCNKPKCQRRYKRLKLNAVYARNTRYRERIKAKKRRNRTILNIDDTPYIVHACLNCGKEFKIKAQNSGSTKYPYCISPECQLARTKAARARNKAAQDKYKVGQPPKLKGNHKANRPKVEYTDRLCMQCGKPVEKYELDEYRFCDDCRRRKDIKASRFDNANLYHTPSASDDLIGLLREITHGHITDMIYGGA